MKIQFDEKMNNHNAFNVCAHRHSNALYLLVGLLLDTIRSWVAARFGSWRRISSCKKQAGNQTSMSPRYADLVYLQQSGKMRLFGWLRIDHIYLWCGDGQVVWLEDTPASWGGYAPRIEVELHSTCLQLWECRRRFGRLDLSVFAWCQAIYDSDHWYLNSVTIHYKRSEGLIMHTAAFCTPKQTVFCRETDSTRVACKNYWWTPWESHHSFRCWLGSGGGGGGVAVTRIVIMRQCWLALGTPACRRNVFENH